MTSHLAVPARERRSIGQWDLAGVGVSVACIIHCVAPPVLVALLPAAGVAWLADETLGWGLVTVAGLIAMVALGAGWARHRRTGPLLFGGTGVAVMALGHSVASSATWEAATGLVAGAALVAAHLWNRALMRAAPVCHCATCAAGADQESAPAALRAESAQGSSAVGP